MSFFNLRGASPQFSCPANHRTRSATNYVLHWIQYSNEKNTHTDARARPGEGVRRMCLGVALFARIG